MLTSAPREDKQQLYYRILLFDNEDGRGKIPAPVPSNPEKPVFDEQRLAVAKELLELSTKQPGNVPQQVIRLLNQNPPDATVLAFLPMKKGQKDIAEATGNLLALRNVPTRMVRGIKLEENKKSFTPDLMLEAYTEGRWTLYDLKTGKKGLPENFVVIQRGGDSLLDIEGGNDSVVKYSVLKSISSSFNLAQHRAKLANQKTWFDYSIYSRRWPNRIRSNG